MFSATGALVFLVREFLVRCRSRTSVRTVKLSPTAPIVLGLRGLILPGVPFSILKCRCS